MDTHVVPAALRALEQLIGCETALDHFHGTLRRAAQSIQPVHGYGMVQVTCSDEFQGDLRASFERDVARALTSGTITGHRHTFSLSNMGGRLEAGALALAQQHFAVEDRLARARLLLVELSAHVGVRSTAQGKVWGQVERGGAASDCCGALATLLANPTSAAAVRHPWFDQLSAFLGEERLGVLRADTTPTRMLSTAILHAVLQGESAVADVLRDPPAIPTHVLIVVLVAINQTSGEQVLPVGFHHLYADGSEVSVVHGVSLRSTPGALRFSSSAGRLVVTSDEGAESTGERRVVLHPPHELVQQVEQVRAAKDEAGRARAQLLHHELRRTRKQVERLKQHPHVWRVYARPMLRGLIQGLSVIAPEVGVAAMLVQSGHDALRAEHLRHLLKKGPSSAEARRTLHDMEAELQQLGHRDAQDVLEILLQETHKLLT
jgi:hypothetical protein